MKYIDQLVVVGHYIDQRFHLQIILHEQTTFH